MTGLLVRAFRKILRTARRTLGPEPQWLKHKRKVDREFDSAQGIDTGGVTQLKDVGVPRESWSEGVPHIAVDPVEFATALEAVDCDLSGLTFIDLGSGKGRALVLAADYRFKRIIGVEFAEPLVETARANIRHLSERRDLHRVEVVHSDARTYDFPHEPELIFLYNPFGSSMMEKVADRARASLLAAPRDLVVLYLNPFFLDAWLEAGFKLVKRGPHFAVLNFRTA